MAKNWYPVIDRLACEECGTCVDKCTHGVYDKSKAPVPAVVKPENCIDHCHGCGNTCPNGAVSFAGDDTGWTAPALKKQPAEDAGCCCCSGGASEKEVNIEYLFLDLNTCDRCIGTDAVLDEVVDALRPALELAGYQVRYRKQEIASVQLAEAYRFLSSPTIRVNGQDIFGSVQESDCGCCGEIAGVQVDCRVFEHEGKTYEVPTREMLAEGILKTLYHPSTCCRAEYRLPENLKRFFAGKEKSGSPGRVLKAAGVETLLNKLGY